MEPSKVDEHPEPQYGRAEANATLSLQAQSGYRCNVYSLPKGATGTIEQVTARGAVRQRLLDMGVLPSYDVTKIRTAPGGSPVWVEVHGVQIALRKNEAESIFVQLK